MICYYNVKMFVCPSCVLRLSLVDVCGQGHLLEEPGKVKKRGIKYFDILYN